MPRGGARSAAHTSLVQACLELLERRRWNGRKVPARKQNTGAMLTPRGALVRFSFPGCADILGLLPPDGRGLAIECKTGAGALTDNQRAFKVEVEEAGGVYLEVRDVAQLNNWLDVYYTR